VTNIFQQGEFIEVDFDPTKGHEPKKRRPALVLSSTQFNVKISSLTVVCPITSVDNGHPFHIRLPDKASVEGFVCVEQLRSIDLESRNARTLDSTIDIETMSYVLDAVGVVFDI
jgi:mRNA interferase MazF